jgi:thiamine biosynthesis lipoprotein
MGTRVRIVLYAPTEARAVAAARAAFERIADLDAALTDYNPESELSRLGSEAYPDARGVSSDLLSILERAERYSSISEGAFDVTLGPVVALWRQARRSHALPDPEALSEARTRTGYRKIVLDRSARTVRLLEPGMKLDLGGIGKGFAADRALEVLRARGLEQALVAAGGDIAVGAPPPGAAGWRIGIGERGTDPAGDLVLHDCGVSTSGDTEQFVEIDGVRYAHIVDPRTGLGVRGAVRATVVAPDDTAADALATALCVLEPDAGLRLIESIDGAAAYLLRQGAGAPATYCSKRMSALFAPRQ